MSTASPEARANAQGGFGFYVGLALRHKGKGIRTLRIDAELLRERTSLGQLDRNEAKIATAIMFAYEAASARAQDAYPVEQDQAVPGVDPAGTYWINDDWLHRLHGKSKHLHSADQSRWRGRGRRVMFLHNP